MKGVAIQLPQPATSVQRDGMFAIRHPAQPHHRCIVAQSPYLADAGIHVIDAAFGAEPCAALGIEQDAGDAVVRQSIGCIEPMAAPGGQVDHLQPGIVAA
nr:hypothetical protein [Xanthomonas albilineans]